MGVHLGAWYGAVNIYVVDDLINLPTGGEYEITLRGLARDEMFTQRGAMVQMERMRPVGPALLYPIAKWTAYLCLLCACVIVIVYAIKR